MSITPNDWAMLLRPFAEVFLLVYLGVKPCLVNSCLNFFEASDLIKPPSAILSPIPSIDSAVMPQGIESKCSFSLGHLRA